MVKEVEVATEVDVSVKVSTQKNRLLLCDSLHLHRQIGRTKRQCWRTSAACWCHMHKACVLASPVQEFYEYVYSDGQAFARFQAAVGKDPQATAGPWVDGVRKLSL
jgi:hypothetical protein